MARAARHNNQRLLLLTSHDGEMWRAVGRSGLTHDRSTMSWIPYRRRWASPWRDNVPCGELRRGLWVHVVFTSAGWLQVLIT